MSDVILRLTSLLSSNAGTVGAAAVQISGGPAANWPLTAVSATFYPNYHRVTLRIVNTSAANLYLGSVSTLTTTAGYFKVLAPGEFFDDNVSGAVPRWLIGSQAGQTFTVEEYQ